MLDFSNTRSCIWIGVDVGTTGVRAIAYQKDGLSLCSADEFYPLETPYPDWAEQNPEIIYKAIEKVVLNCYFFIINVCVDLVTEFKASIVHLDCADALCEEMLHGNLAYLCA